jgi:hypothetical protein
MLVAIWLAAHPRAVSSQSVVGRLLDNRLVGLGGSEVFVAPRVSLAGGPVTLAAEGVYGRGGSGLTEGRTELAYRFWRDLAIDASYTLTHRALGTVEARDRGGSVGLRSHALGAWLAIGRDHADAPGFDRGTRTESLRVWTDVGPGVGLTLRRADLTEQGEVLRDTVHVILGEYEFHTRRLSPYFRADDYSELELDVSFRTWEVGVVLVGGHRFADAEALAADWGFARLTLRLSRRVALMGEAGRNGGLPSVGLAPAGFARIGVRLDLTGQGADPGSFRPPAGAPPGSPEPVRAPRFPRAEVMVEGEATKLVLVAPRAHLLELRGDFTDWRPMHPRETAPGRWVHPLGAGVYRLNIRLDGGDWTVPANLPTVPDEFTGAPVAVLVVR